MAGLRVTQGVEPASLASKRSGSPLAGSLVVFRRPRHIGQDTGVREVIGAPGVGAGQQDRRLDAPARQLRGVGHGDRALRRLRGKIH